MSKKVDLDEDGNWMVSHREQKLKAMGWRGTLREWDQAFDLLGDNPLEQKPPIKSLADAKKHAKKK